MSHIRVFHAAARKKGTPEASNLLLPSFAQTRKEDRIAQTVVNDEVALISLEVGPLRIVRIRDRVHITVSSLLVENLQIPLPSTGEEGRPQRRHDDAQNLCCPSRGARARRVLDAQSTVDAETSNRELGPDTILNTCSDRLNGSEKPLECRYQQGDVPEIVPFEERLPLQRTSRGRLVIENVPPRTHACVSFEKRKEREPSTRLAFRSALVKG
jgi:hypothetical protein